MVENSAVVHITLDDINVFRSGVLSMKDNGIENFDIITNELEFKYDGSHVTLTNFNKWAESQNPIKKIEVGSWDVYYSITEKNNFGFDFIRLRLGPKPELTIKIKKNDNNNNDRVEIDLPLNPNAPQKEIEHLARKFCEQLGFIENFRIFKFCSIYLYEKTDAVFYISYDKDMKENGRFIEVEARKDVKFDNKEEAVAGIEALEKKLTVFGITSKNRMKLSQWERNRK